MSNEITTQQIIDNSSLLRMLMHPAVSWGIEWLLVPALLALGLTYSGYSFWPTGATLLALKIANKGMDNGFSKEKPKLYRLGIGPMLLMSATILVVGLGWRGFFFWIAYATVTLLADVAIRRGIIKL